MGYFGRMENFTVSLEAMSDELEKIADRHHLIGAGIGAVLGAGAGALSARGNENASGLKRALAGGLGGAVGGGVGAHYLGRRQGWGNINSYTGRFSDMGNDKTYVQSVFTRNGKEVTGRYGQKAGMHSASNAQKGLDRATGEAFTHNGMSVRSDNGKFYATANGKATNANTYNTVSGPVPTKLKDSAKIKKYIMEKVDAHRLSDIPQSGTLSIPKKRV